MPEGQAAGRLTGRIGGAEYGFSPSRDGLLRLTPDSEEYLCNAAPLRANLREPDVKKARAKRTRRKPRLPYL